MTSFCMKDGDYGLHILLQVNLFVIFLCVNVLNCTDAARFVDVSCDVSHKLYTALQWKAVECAVYLIEQIKVC